jgi:hypothetical protein
MTIMMIGQGPPMMHVEEANDDEEEGDPWVTDRDDDDAQRESEAPGSPNTWTEEFT